MRSWKELGESFRALEGGRSEARLDYQWGSSGEHWRIASVTGRSYPTRFDALAQMAGWRLVEVPSAVSDDVIANETDPVRRWYRALVRLSGRFEHGLIGTEVNEGGETLGHIFTGTVNAVSEVASDLCLTFEAMGTIDRGRQLSELSHPRYSGPSHHWQEALRLQELDVPDIAGAVHEAVSAVEGMVRLVLGDPAITLGEGISILRRRELVHAALAKCLDGVWGYSSAVPGIRHGADKPPAIRKPEADFAIDSSAAALRLLLSLDARS